MPTLPTHLRSAVGTALFLVSLLVHAAAPTLAANSIVVNNSVQPNTLQLTFSEALSPATATRIANFQVTDNAATLIYTLASAELTSEKTVTLTLAAADPADTKTYITNAAIEAHLKVTPAVTLTNINNVAYAAGTITESGATHVKDITAPILGSSMTVTTNTTVRLTFSEKINKTAATTAAHYTLSGSGGLIGAPTAVTLDSTGTQVTLTIPTLASVAHEQSVLITASTDITDIAGTALAASSRTSMLTADRAPTLSFAPVSNALTGRSVESEAVTLVGFNLLTPITVATGADASLTCAVLPSGQTTWSAFAVCSTFSVNAGDQLKLSLTAAGTASTVVSGAIAIGGVAAAFNVTTAAAVLLPAHISTTPLTSLANTIQSPDSRLYISSNGIVMVPATLSSPITLLYSTALNTAFSIQHGGTATFLLAGANRTIQPQGTESVLAVLKNFKVDGYVDLHTFEIAQGRAVVTSSSSVAPIASLQLGTGTTTKQVALLPDGHTTARVDIKINSDGSGTVAVTAGKVYVRTVAAADAVASTLTSTDTATVIYANEVASLTPTGTIASIRVGTMDNNGLGVGDPLSFTISSFLIKDVDREAKIPHLGAALDRFNSTDTLLQALFDTIGLRSNLDRGGQTAQGVIPLNIDSVNYYFTPIGDVTIDAARTDGVVLSREGFFEISRSGVMAKFKPSLLDTQDAVSSIATSLNSTVHMSSQGALEILGNGNTLLVMPEAFSTAAPGVANGIRYDENGILNYVKNGERQRLLPYFYNMQQLVTTFSDMAASILLQDNLDGTISVVFDDNIFTLAPDYRILSPLGGVPIAHHNDSWWIGENGLIYLKYSNGAAQGFIIR